MIRSFLVAVAGAACSAVIGSITLSADDPVSSNVRFNREIIRILQRRCLPCHTPGGLSISLASYRDVRDWSRAIREEVVEQRMPPTIAAPGFGRFQHPLSLTARETTTLLAWLDGGMPRGDEKDLPPPFDPDAERNATKDVPDVRIPLPPQNVPALEELLVRRITIDPHISTDRLLTRAAIRPGSRSVLRGAVVYADSSERGWIGAWSPWQATVSAPKGRAFKLERDKPLTIVLYYRGADTAVVDRSTLELSFAADAPKSLEDVSIETLAGKPGQLTLAQSTTIWALQPVFASTTRSLELRARRPDGSIEVLLWAPVARAEWPAVLVLEEPVNLPRNTVLILAAQAGEINASDPDRVILSGWTALPHQP